MSHVGASTAIDPFVGTAKMRLEHNTSRSCILA